MCRQLATAFFIACLASLPSLAHAGQGPQDVAVVVNARSPLSIEIAHRYAKLRNIPTANLIYLDWDAPPIGTDVETFRQRIFTPVAQILNERKLSAHVTTIAYSADFPYVIDFQGDLKEDSKLDPTGKRFPQGSLTGMTYLGQLVMAKEVNYANLGVNFYYRPSLDDKLLLPTRTFAPGAVWNQQGDTTDTKGLRYVMSTMLAYTSGRGNSLAEVDTYLHKAAVADGTYPAGKVYFLTNGDIRAKTRAPAFKAAAKRLESFAVAAEVIDGVLPRDRGDVMGAMIGAVDYRFADSASSIRGGAICENLTSFGGIMRENGGQTALSECLRAGAAGSSGTVTEPFAIQAKFPHPMIHAHYAAGCSLVESFYQSVHGPYQLLIVGDPLCRPWATIPTVRAAGLPQPGETIKGTLKLSPSVSIADGKKIGRFELYVDGLLATRCDPGGELAIDTTQIADGAHELRVVAYEDSPIATQGEQVARVVTANYGWKPVELTLEPVNRIAWDQPVTIRASAPGAGAMMLYHHQRLVGSLNADRGAWTLPANKLGPGPGQFVLVATRGAGVANACISAPLAIEVVAPPALAARAAAADTKPGLKLTRDGQEPFIVDRLTDDGLAKASVEANQPFELAGVFTVDAEDLYQFQFEFAGQLEVSVDGKPLLSQPFPKPAMAYVATRLAAGEHALRIQGTLTDAKRLNGWFGHRGTQMMTSATFRYAE